MPPLQTSPVGQLNFTSASKQGSYASYLRTQYAGVIAKKSFFKRKFGSSPKMMILGYFIKASLYIMIALILFLMVQSSTAGVIG